MQPRTNNNYFEFWIKNRSVEEKKRSKLSHYPTPLKKTKCFSASFNNTPSGFCHFFRQEQQDFCCKHMNIGCKMDVPPEPDCDSWPARKVGPWSFRFPPLWRWEVPENGKRDPCYSHRRIPKDLGMVSETYHKGVHGITFDNWQHVEKLWENEWTTETQSS